MSDELEMLKECVRPYDPETDKDLPVFSHSRLETFEQCPYKFDLIYNQGKRSKESTLALSFGSLAHYVLELKGQMILNDEPIDYIKLFDVLDKGCEEEHILGVKALKQKYWDSWTEKNSEGDTYNDKLANVEAVIKSEMVDSDWQVFKTEDPFDFVWRNKIRFTGSIDRIDKRGDDYRIIDYKTNKKPFDSSKIATSQQMGLYNLAMLVKYGQLATENLYRLICINDEQFALTKGWEKRLVNKLDKVFGQIDECYNSKIWKVCTGPLCHWCLFCKTNPDAKEFKSECQFHSNWTPANKDFSVNKEWSPEAANKPKRTFDW